MTRVTVTVDGEQPLTIEIPPADAILIDSLSGSGDNAKLGSSAAVGKSILLPVGVRRMADMAFPWNYPVHGWFMQKVLTLLGAGVDQTILEVTAQSLTQAWAKVSGGKRIEDLAAYSETNPYYAMRAGESLKEIGSFTLRATNQGTNPKTSRPYCYGGLLLYKGSGTRVHDFKLLDFPADASYPPGETFPLNAFQIGAGGLTVEDGEIRGGGTAMTATGATTAGPITVDRVYAHDLYGHGWSSFQLNASSLTSTDLVVRRAASGVNFERWRGGPVRLIRPDLDQVTNGIIIDSDEKSSAITIEDPVGISASNPLKVMIHKTYAYPPSSSAPANKQRRSDVTLLVAGQPRPDLISWQGGGGI